MTNKTPHRTIQTINGGITLKRVCIPLRSQLPLNEQIAKIIQNRWYSGGDFIQLSDAVIDFLCVYIAKSSTEKMDSRISDAIEDHMSVDYVEGDYDLQNEASIDDIDKEKIKLTCLVHKNEQKKAAP